METKKKLTLLDKDFQIITLEWCPTREHIGVCVLQLRGVQNYGGASIVFYYKLCLDCQEANKELAAFDIATVDPVTEESMSIDKWRWLDSHRNYIS